MLQKWSKKLDKKQKVVLSLLKEIDEICRRSNITYYLSPRLTLCAVNGQSLPLNPMAGSVLMKVADMERFRQRIEEDPKEKRALESMKNHKWFPGFYLRYENTDTMCINLDKARDYAYPGIGINIYPLRTEISSGLLQKVNTIEETGWQEMCSLYGSESTGKMRFCKWMVQIRCMVISQQRLAEKMYDRFCRLQQEPGAQKYILKQRKQRLIFPAEIFSETKTIELEGEQFQVPLKTEQYLQICYGNNYQNVPEMTYTMPSQMVLSARVSYTQFWKEAGDFEKYCKSRRQNNRRLEKSRKRKQYFNECWKYAEFCGARIRLGLNYEKKKDYIKNLYKNEDYMTLERVFRPYYKMMQKSLENGELFAEDEEIFDIYSDVLVKTGNTDQAEKIHMLI